MSARARYLAAGVLVLLPVGWPVLLAPVVSEGNAQTPAEVALTFADEAIDESSGLVVTEDSVLTVNDSGDGPYLYGVDPVTGETTGVTTFASEDPVDVEALAPGPGGDVWVADIGDNARVRETIEIFRVTPVPGGGSAAAERFSLRYPDGPHDAEALLVHPSTGQVLVVTKRPFLGGEVYAAPQELDPGVVHRLRRVGAVAGMVTDGAFLPEGDRVVLRTYGTASVHAYPGFEQLAVFTLPEQEQGEGLAVGPDGRLYLSTEGARSDVLVMDLPPVAADGDEHEDENGDESGSPVPPSAGRTEAGREAGQETAGGGIGPWAYGTVAALVAGALGALALRASRRRSRRTR